MFDILSDNDDESPAVEEPERYWHANLELVATGNELCKSSCPECGTTMFDLKCPACDYQDDREISVFTGTIMTVDDRSFTLLGEVEDPDSELPAGSWSHPDAAALPDRDRQEERTSRYSIEFAHEFPVEGLASFASAAETVEVLAVIGSTTLTALEVNG